MSANTCVESQASTVIAGREKIPPSFRPCSRVSRPRAGRQGSCGSGTRGARQSPARDSGLEPFGTPADAEPERRYWITFNGEIYNHEAVRSESGVEREAMHSRTDTEILLLAWERWGLEALPRLVGQWAFAVFDTVERRLWLVRDRFGEKPLFYHESTESLVFASSLEALVQHPQVPRQLEPSALSSTLPSGTW